MIYRLLGSVVVLVSILVLPYWIYLPVLLIAIILFPFFWEGILLAFLINVLYGSGIAVALYALILLIIFLPLRESLRSYV